MGKNKNKKRIKEQNNSGWIRPFDYLPKINEYVLITCNDGDVCLGYRSNKDEWIIDNDWCISNNGVLAWQPLPKPYEV